MTKPKSLLTLILNLTALTWGASSFAKTGDPAPERSVLVSL